MNFSTFVILCLIILIVCIDVRYLIKNGIDDCTGNCAGCGGSCKWAKDIKKARKAIQKEKKLGRS